MENFIFQLQEKLNSTIRDFEERYPISLLQAKNGFEYHSQIIRELIDFQSTYRFKDVLEEIRFFKEIRPAFLREQIYFREVFQIESYKPIGSKNKQKTFFKFCLNEYSSYIGRHLGFFNYCRSQAKDYDSYYFTRGAKKLGDMLVCSPDIDTNITTPHSYILSNILAYEKVCNYLNRQIALLSKSNTSIGTVEIRTKDNFNWTDSKVALIELAYALQAKGSINFGNTDVKQIITRLEELFNLKLGNFYRVYMDMLIRKKGRTPFIDSLKEYLERRMDEAD